MRAVPQDVREKVIRLRKEGLSFPTLSKRFSLGLTVLKEIVKEQK